MFTDTQYGTVCDFLGVVFDRFPNLRHLAAQALHWGWNQRTSPALEAAEEYYHRLYAFTYPEPEDSQVADLCHEIHAAFAATPYPGDDQLCGSEQGDEPAEYAMDFRGVRWQSAHPELLAHSYAALSFLSDAGFRYFLPAFLLADLQGYGSNANPTFDLIHGFEDSDEMPQMVQRMEAFAQSEGHDPFDWSQYIRSYQAVDWEEYSRNRFAAFTQEERIAIIHYLKFEATFDSNFDAPKINQALRKYWLPSLQEQRGALKEKI